MKETIEKNVEIIRKLKRDVEKARIKLKEERSKLYDLIESYYMKDGLSIIKIGKMLGYSKVWIYKILEKRNKIKKVVKL